MSRSLTLPRRVGIAAAAFATFLTLSTGAAVAQTPNPTSTPTPTERSALPGAERHTSQAQRKLRAMVIRRVARSLGLTPRALLTELRTGKSIAEIAQARNVSLADLRSAVLDPFAQRLDKAVRDARVTRAQADQRLAKLETRIDALFTHKWHVKAGATPAP